MITLLDEAVERFTLGQQVLVSIAGTRLSGSTARSRILSVLQTHSDVTVIADTAAWSKMGL